MRAPLVPMRRAVGLRCALGVLSLATAGCGGEGETVGTAREAILGGTVVTAVDSPVLFMNGPEGYCTATLVAPNLVVTARHCVAQQSDGPFSCTPEGTLVDPSSPYGQIGTNNAASSLSFTTNEQFVSAAADGGAPAAYGAKILSTGSPTACVDDLAFVVLDRSIAGLTPAALRVNAPTFDGESVSVWGYGLTALPHEDYALRVRHDGEIVGVGPVTPPPSVQPAPIRAIRIGPGDLTCNGDSGGPITSNVTGALIAVVSIGTQADPMTLACTNSGTPDTTGPQIANYASLVQMAFAAAGATPIFENGQTGTDALAVDASAASDAAIGAVDARASFDAGEGPDAASKVDNPPAASSCDIAHDGTGRGAGFAGWLLLAWGIVGVGRRRR